MTVAERREGSELEGGGDGVTIGDDSVKTNLVKVRRLEIEHSLDSIPADLISSLLKLLSTNTGSVAAVSSVDKVLTVLNKQTPGVLVSAVQDLDQLGGTISGLTNGEGLEEVKVEESVHGCVVSSKTVLKLLVVNADLDRDGGVDEGNEGSANSDVVGASSVRGTGVTEDVGGETTTNNENRLLSDQTELVHGVNKAEHGVHGLVQLTTLEDVEGGGDVVCVEVCAEEKVSEQTSQ